MELKAPGRRIRFGHCTLDEGRCLLTAPDGTETLLRPKTFELLKLLLQNAGRAVARGEILDSVWPGVYVSDDSITQCVGELRRAMGAGGPALLRTMPRRGYLLEAEVITEQPMALATGMLSPRSDERPSIAVLPFRQDHLDPDDAYFADGIIEGIVHVLAGVDGLFVVSRGSALAFAQVSLDARVVGRELGVRYVLYGGVRRSGGRLRVSTELTEAASGTILRADRHESEAEELFALQDRIADQVVATIAPQLRQHELGRSLRKPPANLTAYDLVLRALDEMRRMDHAALDRAHQLLERAMQADPESALPFSYTAWWHSLRIAQGWAPDVTSEAEAAGRLAEAALLRDRQDAFALALRGFLLAYNDHKFESARRMLDQAVSISPSCAIAWTWGAALRCWLNEGHEAVRWAERALRLAPFDDFTFLHKHILAQAHYTNGAFPLAETGARAALAANPQHLPNWRTLIVTLVALERSLEAREVARRMLDHDPGFTLTGFLARTPLQGTMRDVFAERLRFAGLPD